MAWQRKPRNEATAARVKQYNSAEYKQARRAAKQKVDAGLAYCWRCSRHIDPAQPWHLGHDDNDRAIIHGPECVRCNLRAAARKGARIAHRRRRATDQPTRRAWTL